MVVKKTRSATTHGRKKQTKHVALHPHHARPYRKRHLGLVLLSLTAVITIAILIFQYRDQVIAGVSGSRNFISDMFQSTPVAQTTVESTNGFSLSVDQRKLYVVAVDGFSGTLYEGESLSQKRAYTKLQVATASTAKFQQSQSALTVAYHPDVKQPFTGDELSQLALTSAGIDRKNIDFVRTQQVVLGGKTFEQGIWVTKQTDGPVKNLRASFSTYSTDVNGHPLTIAVSEGVAAEPGKHPQFDNVLQSLRFGTPVANAPQQTIAASTPASQTIFDTILMANIASAATTHTTNDSEKTAALYGPAVAKIYNVYCMDLVVAGRPFVSNYCGGGTGSGFFVSQDGYFATNGHVAAVKPKDIAIYFSYLSLALTGSSSYMEYLLELSGSRQSDFAAIADPEELADKLVDTLYKIDDSKFEKRNDVQNTFVVLGDKQPDNKILADDTTKRQKIALDSSWKSATLVASDFRLIDGIKSFHASDVAILKVEGAQFPVAQLGSIGDVTQGANLAILGFPGTASENGLVDSKTTTATLTTGKVSSKKSASGSDRQLIETDTTIGKGNSGGPAFSDEGKVIGIATYTSDGGGQGGGTFNYIRDIKDLQDLAASSSISFDTASQTQTEWETGMGYFYESRYSKALANFAKVKELYPSHNKVAEFIGTAEKRIANGEDVVDFPVVPVAVAATVAMTGLGIGIFLIVRHKKRHTVYKAGVMQGSVVSGVSQTVAVSNGPIVQPVEPAAPADSIAPPAPLQQAPSLQDDPKPITNQAIQPVAQAIVPVAEASPSIDEVSIDRIESLPVEDAQQPAGEPEYMQPIMTTEPRTPAPFSVPTRTNATPPVSRPIAPAQNRPRV